MVTEVWSSFLFIIVRDILFYNVAVDSGNRDMLGFGWLSRSQGIVRNRKYWTEMSGYRGRQCFSIFLNVIWLFPLYRRVLYFWIAYSQVRANLYDNIFSSGHKTL